MPVYYAAVLLWGGRAYKPLVQITFHSQSTETRRPLCHNSTGAKTRAAVVIQHPVLQSYDLLCAD